MFTAREGGQRDSGHQACLSPAVVTQRDPSQAKKGALPGSLNPSGDIPARRMHCESLHGSRKMVMASILLGISGNAGCQELVNAIGWETQIEVFPGSHQMSWP